MAQNLTLVTGDLREVQRLGIELERQAGRGLDSCVYAIYELPGTSWRWYILGWDGGDVFYGLVMSDAGPMLGRFSLAGLERLQGPAGERVRVDPGWRFGLLRVALDRENWLQLVDFLPVLMS